MLAGNISKYFNILVLNPIQQATSLIFHSYYAEQNRILWECHTSVDITVVALTKLGKVPALDRHLLGEPVLVVKVDHQSVHLNKSQS